MTQTQTTPTVAELLARIADLEAQANSKGVRKITLKVAEKSKAIQINGIRRFPIVLFKEEMQTILAMTPDIQAFIQANESALATKA